MTVVRYHRNGRPWDEETVPSPTWEQVEAAIRRMDNYCFPIVRLNCTEHDDADDVFIVIGGAGRYALFQMMAEWQYEDQSGGTAEVRLWESDQGYFCQERNVLTDIEKVLRITKAYYETGSYARLDSIE
ncbi:MAG: hypothetical protein WD066_00305 [Planctomycetaceae bacterium]